MNLVTYAALLLVGTGFPVVLSGDHSSKSKLVFQLAFAVLLWVTVDACSRN